MESYSMFIDLKFWCWSTYSTQFILKPQLQFGVTNWQADRTVQIEMQGAQKVKILKKKKKDFKF